MVVFEAALGSRLQSGFGMRAGWAGQEGTVGTMGGRSHLGATDPDTLYHTPRLTRGGAQASDDLLLVVTELGQVCHEYFRGDARQACADIEAAERERWLGAVQEARTGPGQVASRAESVDSDTDARERLYVTR
jgi:hypothetical protein